MGPAPPDAARVPGPVTDQVKPRPGTRFPYASSPKAISSRGLPTTRVAAGGVIPRWSRGPGVTTTGADAARGPELTRTVPEPTVVDAVNTPPAVIVPIVPTTDQAMGAEGTRVP